MWIWRAIKAVSLVSFTIYKNPNGIINEESLLKIAHTFKYISRIEIFFYQKFDVSLNNAKILKKSSFNHKHFLLHSLKLVIQQPF